MEPCQPRGSIPKSFATVPCGWCSRSASRPVAARPLAAIDRGLAHPAAQRLTMVAEQLGVHREALRGWVRQAEVDGGQRPGVPTAEQQRIAEMEREVRELRRANETSRAA